MTQGLLALRDWLCAQQVRVVGMESTGTYRKPVYYLLEDELECWLAQRPPPAQPAPAARPTSAMRLDLPAGPGTAWSAPASCHPDRSASCATPTRDRKVVIQERTREVQRLHKVLEDAGTPAVVGGHRHPGGVGPGDAGRPHRGGLGPCRMAELAKGRLRTKLPALRAALGGHLDRHHGLLAAELLPPLDTADATIGRLSAEIDRAIARTRGRWRCCRPFLGWPGAPPG